MRTAPSSRFGHHTGRSATSPGAHGSFNPSSAVGGPGATGAPVWSIGRSLRSVTQGVEWSLLYVCLLAYLASVITSRIPLAQPAMAGAVIGLGLQRYPMRAGRVVVMFAILLTWTALGYLTSEYQQVVGERLLDQLKLGFIVFVSANAIRSRAQVRFLVVFVLLCFAAYPGRGTYLNYITGANLVYGGRVIWNGIYSNPNDLAAITLLMIGLAAFLVVGERRGLVRTCAIVGLPLLVLLIAFTQSRGALIALAFFGLMLVSMSRGAHRRRAIALGIGAILTLVAFAPSTMWDRLRGLRGVTRVEELDRVDKEGSAEQRYEIWRVARTIVAERPVLGVGLGAYSRAHERTARRSQFNPTARGARDTHSTYLNVAAELGLPGLLMFVGLVGATLSDAERGRRRLRRADPVAAKQLLMLELTISAFLIAGLWGSYAKLNVTYVMLVITWAFRRATALPRVATPARGRIGLRNEIAPRTQT